MVGDQCGRLVIWFEARKDCKVIVTKYLIAVIRYNDKINKGLASKASTSLPVDNLSLEWGKPQLYLSTIDALESDDNTHVIRPYVSQSLC